MRSTARLASPPAIGGGGGRMDGNVAQTSASEPAAARPPGAAKPDRPAARLKTPALRLRAADIAAASLISLDLFDTLLLRNGASERLRTARSVARAGGGASLLLARREALAIGYRSVTGACVSGDVRQHVLLECAAAAVGDSALAERLFEAEFEVERRGLRLDRVLADDVRTLKKQGKTIIVVSDFPWPSEALMRLLGALGGQDCVDRIYSSGEIGLTKRHGALFEHVARAEGVEPGAIFHLGDDWTADVERPQRLGVSAVHRPRGAGHLAVRKLRTLASRTRLPRIEEGARTASFASKEAFGREVMGPILADICWRFWTFLSLTPARETGAALFAARGGLRMRRALELYMQSGGLAPPMPFADVMISRIAAARLAFDRAPDAVAEELAREGHILTLRDGVRALSALDPGEDPVWSETMAPQRFLHLLATTPHGEAARRSIARQGELLRRHMDRLLHGRTHMFLCDTGLFGSTGRFVSAGAPDIHCTSLMIARANYRRVDVPHFEAAVGLISESDRYAPANARSSVLRYWHFIESLFEPELPSVRWFEEGPGGDVISNLEVEGWRDLVDPEPGSIAAGAFAYLADLTPDRRTRAPERSEQAWQRLRQMICSPQWRDVDLLDVGERSFDLGLDSSGLAVEAGGRERGGRPPLMSRPQLVRHSLWREGAIRSLFPASAPVLHAALNAAHRVRSRLRRFDRRA